MAGPLTDEPKRGAGASMRTLAEQTFSRTAGAPLVAGNAMGLLQDARENFPAWLEALAQAQRSILFENYIFTDDRVGRAFAASLKAVLGAR